MKRRPGYLGPTARHMRTLTITILALLHLGSFAQYEADTLLADSTLSEEQLIERVEEAFLYEHGLVTLGNGLATLHVPTGFKFLDAHQSLRVITELWGNTTVDHVLGIMLPESDRLMDEAALAFVLQYEPVGRVSADDAADLDPQAILGLIQEREVDDNRHLAEQGYGPAYTLAWAMPPVFDDERHVLHWAKELQVGEGDDSGNLLIADIRFLGRRGVLVANTVTVMDDRPRAEHAMQLLLGALQFGDDDRYERFIESVDESSPWTLSGLLSGRPGVAMAREEEPSIMAMAAAALGGIALVLLLAWWWRRRSSNAGA